MKFEKKKKENDREKYCRNTLWPCILGQPTLGKKLFPHYL